MQINPEEFRRRFDGLSDDALLEVNRDELVEVAQDLYDAELERRGLIEESAEEEPEPAEGAPEDPKDDLVFAAEFGSAQELAFARSLLKSSGIPTYGQTDFSGILAATEADTKLYVPSLLSGAGTRTARHTAVGRGSRRPSRGRRRRARSRRSVFRGARGRSRGRGRPELRSRSKTLAV